MAKDAVDKNFQNFRIAITLQDMAYLKIFIGNLEDAFLHL